MEWFLVFDSGCSFCTKLAQDVEEAADRAVKAVSIYEPTVRSLLDQALPQGWAHAPYLLAVAEGNVHAWTGPAAALRLAWVVGPRKAWRIWGIVRSASQSSAAAPMNIARRRLLKLGALASLATWLGLPAPSAADDWGKCDSVYCILTHKWCGCNSGCGSCYYIGCRDRFESYDCYATSDGSICYSSTYTYCSACAC